MRRLFGAFAAALLIPGLAFGQTVGLSTLTPTTTMPPGASVLLRVGAGTSYSFGATTPAAIVAAGITNDFVAAHCATFTGSLPGCVPASNGGSTTFLRSDGTWSVPASGGGSYVLPVATSGVLGGVKQGTGVTIAGDGTLSASAAAAITPVTTIAACSGAQSLAFPASGSIGYYITLSGSCPLTLSGGTAGQVQTLILVIRGRAGGGSAPLPSNVKWPGGQVPTVDSSAGAYNEFVIRTLDGATYSGSY